MKTIPLSQGLVALVDDADFEWLSQWKWTAQRRTDGKTHYAIRCVYADGTQTRVFMHREIMQAPEGIEVDHRDFDGLHNTRDNVRLATHPQNQANRRPLSNNSSGFKGVGRSANGQRWQASIRVNGRGHYLGGYLTKEAAALAYDAAAREHFGEFACLNFPDQHAPRAAARFCPQCGVAIPGEKRSNAKFCRSACLQRARLPRRRDSRRQSVETTVGLSSPGT